MAILVTGGTGFLGSALVEALLRQGHQVVLSSRKKNSSPYPVDYVSWPLKADELKPYLPKLEACIHLAGEPIASKRWSKEQKDKIKNSRWEGTQSVVRLLARAPNLKCFLSASAIGFYGDRGDEELTEASTRGDGFLAEVCDGWENNSKGLSQARTVLLRTGVVFGRQLGMLGELESLFKNGLGGPVGSGKQFISWIHVKDWVKAVMHCLNEESLSGPVNLVGCKPVSNREFSKDFANHFGYSPRPAAPAFVLKTTLGELSQLALHSQKVLPTKLQETGFQFEFKELQSTFRDLWFLDEGGEPHDEVLTTCQFISKNLEETFQFFENEKNLETLTPEFLNFKVVGKSTENLQSGTLIDYKLKIHGFPAKWQSRIDDWDPPHKFSDTQLKGPYAKWYHLHTFESLKDGTLIKDRVIYKLPMGMLGRLFGKPIVKKDVSNIFNYRKEKITQLFG